MLIYDDLQSKRRYRWDEMYVDFFGEQAYLDFLMIKNTATMPERSVFKSNLRYTGIGLLRPDMLIHTLTEQVFYEVKPNSITGVRDGELKLGALSGTYKYYKLPYRLGYSYTAANIPLARLSAQSQLVLSTELRGPGLIAYKVCVDGDAKLDEVAVRAILFYALSKIIKLPKNDKFPVDLEPNFRRERELSQFAQSLGLTMVVAGTAAVSWKYFWKAVTIRFAIRGAAATTLAQIPTPMAVGQLLALGLTIWMVVDIIRLSDSLWEDARKLSTKAA